MVHIKEIRMTGWKSYGPGTVRMPLAKGFTVIVGPNGSGKSNSIDAVNFCLGALSKKSMRADKMVGLIYNGIGGKKKSEKAFVEIVFDNSDFAIPIRESEVIVSRELKTNGSGTYRLNGKRTTRTDILDKLRIAGIDVVNSYNIIAQGQVGEIVGMNPIERRQMMENLAGVGQFDTKKHSALSELEEANKRMDELQLLVGEVAKRVESLRKEKEDAERWSQLDTEILNLKALLISYSFHNNNRALVKFDEDIASIRSTQENIISERSQIDTNVEEVTEKIRTLEDSLIRVETSLKEIRSSAEEKNIEKTKVQEKSEYNKKTIKSNENRVKQLESRSEEIQKKIQDDSQTKDELHIKKEELVNRIEHIQSDRTSLEEELELKNQEYDEIKAEFEDSERRQKIENDRLTKTQVSFEVSQNMVDAFQNNVDEYQRRQSEAEEQIDSAELKAKQLKVQIEEESNQQTEASVKLEELQTKKDNLEIQIEEIEGNVRELSDKQLVLKAKIETISSFVKSEAGRENPAVSYINGKKNEASISGILGEFQNLSEEGVNLPPEVGHLSDAIITDTIESSLKCINLLKEHSIGAANFIPLEKFKLKTTDNFSNIVKKIREQNQVVSSLDEAANLWKKHSSTLSTADGDIFYSNGIIFGGFHLLSAQASVDSLKSEMEQITSELGEYKSRFTQEKENQKKLLGIEKVVVSSIEKLQKSIQGATLQLNQQESEIKLYSENQQSIEGELDPLKQKLEERLINRDKQKEEMDHHEQNLEVIGEEVKNIGERLEAADTRPLLEKMNQIEQRLGKSQGQLSGIDSRIESLETQKEERDARLSETKNEINTIKVETANLEGEIQVLGEQVDQFNADLEKILENEESLLTEIKDYKSDLSTQKKYQGQLIIIPADAEELEKINEQKINSEINRKSDEKKRLEPVNMRALKEFQSENSRYIELLDRRDILIEERQVILDFIEEIETEKYSVFMKVYKSVNRHFGLIFNELSGGDARLILEKDPKKGEDIFEGGLFIEAHPAGKKIASLESMSGGEKALTALAFIFAVQTVDAQPFYILDEIDAALDPMNVRRVAKLLYKMSRSVGRDGEDEDGKKSRKSTTPAAQFLVISHRDILMAWADRLYGCTNVKGLSSVFSIQMSEDQQLERDQAF
ncbi:MAG: AAA family ATPase [Candidatus Hodarchaeales archaeon]